MRRTATLGLACMLTLLITTGVDGQACTTGSIFTTAVSFLADGNLGPSACSGYLLNNGEGICGFLDNRAAERACWDRGLNGGADRAYSCAPTTAVGVNLVDTTTPGTTYTTLGAGGTIGQNCLAGDPDCFLDCHVTGGTTSAGVDATTIVIATNCRGNDREVAITCSDLNECSDGVLYDCTGPFKKDCSHRIYACGPRAVCTNTVGSFTCACDADTGYGEGTATDLVDGCTDTDECDTPNVCGADAVCENTPGSFVCLCDAGYTWDDSTTPGTCDINTCPPVLDIPNAQTTLGGGEYGDSSSYNCNPGYEPSFAATDPFTVVCRDDGTNCACSAPTCQRIKCDLPVGDNNARTPVTSKEFETTLTYTCDTGYAAGGAPSYSVDCQANGMWENPSVRCEDINECTANADACPDDSTCFNTIGSHFCICDPGYEGDDCDRISCGDIPVVANAQITTTLSVATGVFGMIVNYRCEAGYHVSYDEDPNSVLTNFDLECKQDKCWSPQPVPQCVPVSCGDPGILPFAKRSPGNFFFMDEISYTCVKGYRPSDYQTSTQTNHKSFTINCGADGMWSPKPHCTDINECLETNTPCGPGDGHICINKDGSYTCSCASYYRLDQTGQNCIGFPVKPDDVKEPCKIYTSLGMCNWGRCQDDDYGKPHCRCDEGYSGAFCDRPDYEIEEHKLTSLPFILAIVSLALAFFALMIAIIVACCFCLSRRHHHGSIIKHVDHHVDRAPIYQSTPPLGGGYPRAGFMMALRNKATNKLYPLTQ